LANSKATSNGYLFFHNINHEISLQQKHEFNWIAFFKTLKKKSGLSPE
jgi:hypothetical protein